MKYLPSKYRLWIINRENKKTPKIDMGDLDLEDLYKDIKNNIFSDSEIFIYFIKSKNQKVKIGRSKKPYERYHDLERSSPHKLKLLGFFRSSSDMERKIHKKFKKCRSHGEWFYINDEISGFIEKCLSFRYLSEKS